MFICNINTPISFKSFKLMKDKGRLRNYEVAVDPGVITIKCNVGSGTRKNKNWISGETQNFDTAYRCFSNVTLMFIFGGLIILYS
jgi:hypothetical protein